MFAKIFGSALEDRWIGWRKGIRYTEVGATFQAPAPSQAPSQAHSQGADTRFKFTQWARIRNSVSKFEDCRAEAFLALLERKENRGKLYNHCGGKYIPGNIQAVPSWIYRLRMWDARHRSLILDRIPIQSVSKWLRWIIELKFWFLPSSFLFFFSFSFFFSIMDIL